MSPDHSFDRQLTEALEVIDTSYQASAKDNAMIFNEELSVIEEQKTTESDKKTGTASAKMLSELHEPNTLYSFQQHFLLKEKLSSHNSTSSISALSSLVPDSSLNSTPKRTGLGRPSLVV